MIRREIRVLLVEDSPSDVLLVRKMLQAAAHHRMILEQADTLGRGMASLENRPGPDVVLLDLGLPDSDSLETFLRVNDAAPMLPVIVLTSLEDAELAVHAVQSGAQDYLMKGDLNAPLLERSIVYALERKRLVGQVQDNVLAELDRRELESLAALSPGGIVPEPDHGAGDLREVAPDVFNEMVRRYREVLERQLAAGNPKTYPARTEALQALANHIGLYRAGPGVVIDIHLAGIGATAGWEASTLGTRYADVGRLMVLELMGCLTAYYRDALQSGGAASPPSS